MKISITIIVCFSGIALLINHLLKECDRLDNLYCSNLSTSIKRYYPEEDSINYGVDKLVEAAMVLSNSCLIYCLMLLPPLILLIAFFKKERIK
jgi:hypothetical protein